MVTSMTCAVCGDYAGMFEQWHNRDKGYGVCAECVDWLQTKRQVPPEEIKRHYGEAGVHYSKPVNDASNN